MSALLAMLLLSVLSDSYSIGNLMSKPTNVVILRLSRWPQGWSATAYDKRGYAAQGRLFADKLGARRWAAYLSVLYKVRIIELQPTETSYANATTS